MAALSWLQIGNLQQGGETLANDFEISPSSANSLITAKLVGPSWYCLTPSEEFCSEILSYPEVSEWFNSWSKVNCEWTSIWHCASGISTALAPKVTGPRMEMIVFDLQKD